MNMTNQLNPIEEKVYKILLNKQSYLKEQKKINKLYFGKEYLKRLVEYNQFEEKKVISAIYNLRKYGLIKGDKNGKSPFDYYKIISKDENDMSNPKDEEKKFKVFDIITKDIKPEYPVNPYDNIICFDTPETPINPDDTINVDDIADLNINLYLIQKYIDDRTIKINGKPVSVLDETVIKHIKGQLEALHKSLHLKKYERKTN